MRAEASLLGSERARAFAIACAAALGGCSLLTSYDGLLPDSAAGRAPAPRRPSRRRARLRRAARPSARPRAAAAARRRRAAPRAAQAERSDGGANAGGAEAGGGGSMRACPAATLRRRQGGCAIRTCSIDATTATSAPLEACTLGCLVRPQGHDDACHCTPGGFYCGGDKVEGNPNTLYKCKSDGTGSVVRHCTQTAASSTRTRTTPAADACPTLDFQTALHEMPGARRLTRHLPQLAFRDARGERVFAVERLTLAGSADAADLAIADKPSLASTPSSRPREDGLWVRDLGSRNGTYVDGLQVTGARVPDKGKVRFGSKEVVVDYNPFGPRFAHVEVWPDAGFGRPCRPKRLACGSSSRRLRGSRRWTRRSTSMEKRVRARSSSLVRFTMPRRVRRSRSSSSTPLHCPEPTSSTPSSPRGTRRRCVHRMLSAPAPAPIESAHGRNVFFDEIGELHDRDAAEAASRPRVAQRSTPVLGRPRIEASMSASFRRRTATSSTMVNGGRAQRRPLLPASSVLPVGVPPSSANGSTWSSSSSASCRTPRRGLAASATRRAPRSTVKLGNTSADSRNVVERAAAFGARRAIAMSDPPPSRPPPPLRDPTASRPARSPIPISPPSSPPWIALTASSETTPSAAAGPSVFYGATAAA